MIDDMLRLQNDASLHLFQQIFGDGVAQHLHNKFEGFCNGNILRLWAGLDACNREHVIHYLSGRRESSVFEMF
jgi:hypothetical protein